MASSNSAISSNRGKTRQSSNNYGGAVVYENKSKYSAKYIRNTLLSRRITAKKALATNGSPSQLNIMSKFHT